ncbi:MAG: phosphoglycerate dehydrogenase [Fidelibacterota bacterium]
MQVLITDPIGDVGKSILKSASLKIIEKIDTPTEQLKKILPDIDGWIVRSGTKVTQELLKEATKLKVIGRAGVGVDNIDIQEATLRGIVVMNTPGVNTIAAAEHTIALILSLVRNVHRGHLSLMEGQWERHRLVGSELRGKTLGVIGLGKVGSEVIKRLYGFGMEILGYDPYIKPENYELDYVEFVDVDRLCRESDIITLHVPLVETTKDLIDMERLKTMKPSSYLINCARGGVVNEQDLSIALERGIISGSAVDVFSSEPALDTPLAKAPNILLTPHLGASTQEAKEGVSRAVCEQIRDYLNDGKLENALNIPISDLSLLRSLEPHLNLATKIGIFQQQINNQPTDVVHVETRGTITEVKLITLAFLKGFLGSAHGSSINFVNALAIAQQHGIEVEETYHHGKEDYVNLISTTVSSDGESMTIRGSLFSDKHPRIVYFNGFHFDLNPTGVLLIVENEDIPGVVGKMGTYLGKIGANIAGYQLSRKVEHHYAMGIIRLDTPISEDNLRELTNIKEIISIRQITL